MLLFVQIVDKYRLTIDIARLPPLSDVNFQAWVQKKRTRKECVSFVA